MNKSSTVYVRASRIKWAWRGAIRRIRTVTSLLWLLILWMVRQPALHEWHVYGWSSRERLIEAYARKLLRESGHTDVPVVWASAWDGWSGMVEPCECRRRAIAVVFNRLHFRFARADRHEAFVVVAHEISHVVAGPDEGHSEEFERTFRTLCAAEGLDSQASWPTEAYAEERAAFAELGADRSRLWIGRPGERRARTEFTKASHGAPRCAVCSTPYGEDGD